jgi:hypothetical protein
MRNAALKSGIFNFIKNLLIVRAGTGIGHEYFTRRRS